MNGPASLPQIGGRAKQPEEIMISAPKDIFGPNAFQMFVHELGLARVSKILEVKPTTIRRWMRGVTPVPQMAVLALYWETQYGRSLIESEMVNEIRLLYQRNRILQEQFTKAKDMVAGLRRLHSGTANEPLFEELLNCYEKEGIQSQFVTVGTSEHSSPSSAHQTHQRKLPAKSETHSAQGNKTLKKAAAA